MRAYAYVDRIGPDALVPVERPDPVPGPHDVVLRMQAAALNYRDLAIARGHYHIKCSPPLVPVSDGAGDVIAVGSQVTRLQTGEIACPVYLPDWIDGPASPRVLRRRLGGPTDGVLSELLCLNEEEVVRAPSHMDAVEASTLPITAVTAWQSLYQLGCLRPGETLVVLGTGGVSTAALQLARAGGVQVIAVVRRPEQECQMREFGAHHVVLAPGTTDWPRRVAELTAGRGADAVIDVVGGDSLRNSIAATRSGGTVHVVGYAAETDAHFDIFDAIRHATTIRVAVAGNRNSFEALIRVMEQQTIRTAIHRTFPIARWREAFECLANGGHFGKIVLKFA